mgnify:CR=1 FL=1
MPIPYRDVDDVEELGLAAYLRIMTSWVNNNAAQHLLIHKMEALTFPVSYSILCERERIIK